MTFRASFEAYLKIFRNLNAVSENSNNPLNVFREFLIETAIQHKHVYAVDDQIVLPIVLERINTRGLTSKSKIFTHVVRHDLLSGFPPLEVEIQGEKFVWLEPEDDITEEDTHYWCLLLVNCLNFNNINVTAFLNQEYERTNLKSAFLKSVRSTMKEECVRKVLPSGMLETIQEWLEERDRSQKAFPKNRKAGKDTQIKSGWMKGVILFMRLLAETENQGFCSDCAQKELAEALSILSRGSVDGLEQEYSKFKKKRSTLTYDDKDFQKVRSLLNAMQNQLNKLEIANKSQ